MLNNAKTVRDKLQNFCQAQGQCETSSVKTRPWARGCKGLAHPPQSEHCTEGQYNEISGAIFGCLLLEQVAIFGEYFCRFLRPAVAGRRKEKFYHHHNSRVLRSIFGLVSVMALILRPLPLPSLKGHNSAPWSLIDLNPFPRARPLPGLGDRHWKCSKSPFLAKSYKSSK